jgi:hypothetical protein
VSSVMDCGATAQSVLSSEPAVKGTNRDLHLVRHAREKLAVSHDSSAVSQWQDDLLSVARFIADCFDHFQSGGDPS